jgi:hypothetical protein
MRLLILAPFPRGRGHGGSQRATALAERLEERGVHVGWQTLERRDTPAWRKLAAAARLEPALPGLYRSPPPVASADWDVALIAHSYLAPAVIPALLGDVPAVIDFHNLEWRHLADVRPPLARAVYHRTQVALMRRLERHIVHDHPLSLFVSTAERDWARRAAPGGRTFLLPSVLPRGEEERARAVAAARQASTPDPTELAYVGTLTFPPNAASLRHFLGSAWPAMRRAAPSLNLTLAGRGSEQFAGQPGVRALGFVEDLGPILSRAGAVVMPFEGTAGTSLRALFYALSGLPAIGSPAAFRGVPFAAGVIARGEAEWGRAAQAVTRVELIDPEALEAARRAAELHQSNPAPWDDLRQAIADVSAPAADRGKMSSANATW